MTTAAHDRARTVIAARYICRCCGHEEVRHLFSVKDYEHDVMAQNLLCMQCYITENFEPGSLIPYDQLPVIPHPTHIAKPLIKEEESR